MDSAFLVFDLVGGDAGFQRERDARRFVHPKLDDPEEAVGLVVGERVNRIPAANASPNSTGRIKANPFLAIGVEKRPK